VRASAADQNGARQLEAIGEVDRLISEKVSGKSTSDREQLKEMRAYVRDGDTAQGEFMLTILAAVAQLELATIRERQAEGVAIVKRNGVYDRGPKLTSEQVSETRQRADSGVPKA